MLTFTHSLFDNELEQFYLRLSEKGGTEHINVVMGGGQGVDNVNYVGWGYIRTFALRWVKIIVRKEGSTKFNVVGGCEKYHPPIQFKMELSLVYQYKILSGMGMYSSG